LKGARQSAQKQACVDQRDVGAHPHLDGGQSERGYHGQGRHAHQRLSAVEAISGLPGGERQPQHRNDLNQPDHPQRQIRIGLFVKMPADGRSLHLHAEH
jgi:hypothetical protein